MLTQCETLNHVLPINDEEAYHLGYDYVSHGANHLNCHFAIFCNPEKTAAWEAGRLAAERETWSVVEREKVS